MPLVVVAPALAGIKYLARQRRDEPAHLIRSGGDVDNRIKVLFDAPRMPENCDEFADYPMPEKDEDPFYCLLEDDRLVTEMKVTTDRQLTPVSLGDYQNDVHLVIHVRTLILGATGFTAFLT